MKKVKRLVSYGQVIKMIYDSVVQNDNTNNSRFEANITNNYFTWWHIVKQEPIQDPYGIVSGREMQPKPTEEEVNAKVSELEKNEPFRLLREERNKRLAECDWMANSDVTMSSAWKTYRQSLRDLPSSATPKIDSLGDLDSTSVTWPTKPS